MKSLNKSCFICGGVRCNGIILNGEKICRICEKNIVKTNVYDLKYDKLKNNVKSILFN